jgi:hypothetical protein
LHTNCLLKHVNEGQAERKIEVTGRRQRRSKYLLDDLKKKSGYCKLIQKALYRTLWRIHFGRGYGPVVNRPQNELINELINKGKGKAIPLQAWTGLTGSRRLRLPDFKTIGT